MSSAVDNPDWAVLHTDTTTTQTIQSNLTLAPQKKITLTVSDGASGSITRLIELHASDIVDRPWVGWFDQSNRLVGATGFHDTLNAGEGGTQLKQFEIKTLADPAGLNPTEQRTRFAVPYDKQRILVGFNFCQTLEINQGEVPTDLTGTPIVEQFGLTLRGYKRDGSASQIVGQFVVETETTDAVTGFIDVVNISTTQPHQLVMFKSGNSSSGSCGLFIKRGNNTNTDAFVLKNRTGVFEVGPVATVPSGAATNGRLYVAATGALTYVSPAGTVTAIGPA